MTTLYDTPPTVKTGIDGGKQDHHFNRLKAELHERLINSMNLSLVRVVDPDILRDELRRGAEELCTRQTELLSSADRERMIDELVYETLGLGPQRVPTLGGTIYFAITAAALLRNMWWWWGLPTLLLAFMFIGLLLINLGFDEIANPRLRQSSQ